MHWSVDSLKLTGSDGRSKQKSDIQSPTKTQKMNSFSEWNLIENSKKKKPSSPSGISNVSKPESVWSSDEDSLVKNKFNIFSIVWSKVPIAGLVCARC